MKIVFYTTLILFGTLNLCSKAVAVKPHPQTQAKSSDPCVFPENFLDVAQRYSRQFTAWKLAFEKNCPKEALSSHLKRLFTQPRKVAKKKGPMSMGGIYLSQLRDHLRGLYEASLLDCNDQKFNKKEFIEMLKQAWPKEFCTQYWGWVDARKDWVIKYLQENDGI